jgi:RNA polymerase sigma factor (sigma-70 family)
MSSFRALGGIVRVMDRMSDAEIYAASAKDLVRLATGLVGPDDAPDVVSAAMVRVLSSPSWRRARNQRAYLFRAVVNEARMQRRASVRREARDRRAAQPEVVRLSSTVEALATLDVLSVRQRAVLVLVYWYDQDQRTVAETLGISRGAVARHLARAHARLREVITDDHS